MGRTASVRRRGPDRRRGWRVVLSGYVVLGFSAVILFQLTGRDPHAPAPIPFMAAAMGWGGAFGIVAGYVAAKIARRKETMHGLAVGILMAAGATASMLASP